MADIDIKELKSYVDDMRSQKSESISRESINNRLKTVLEDYTDGTTGMSEEDKKKYEQDIYAKYKTGKKLSTREMSYLARTNPELYMHARRIQLMRNVLEEKLKHCHSKQQADKLIEEAHSMVNDNDPDKQILHAAYDDVMHEFKKSGRYGQLPDKTDEDEGMVITFSYVSWETYYYEYYNEYNYEATAELTSLDASASFEEVV